MAHRLSGLEAGFLYVESPTQPVNSMMLGIVRPPVGPDGRPRPFTPEQLRDRVADKLAVLPSFRWRVRMVPFGVHHPVVHNDPAFDLDFHLRHHTLAAPGDGAALDRFVAGLCEQRLDRRHPLWQLTLIDGVEDGRQAILFRSHHTLLDGVGMTTTVARLFDGEDTTAPPLEQWKAEDPPKSLPMLATALRDQARQLPALGDLVRRTRAGRKAKKAFLATAPVPIPNPLRDTPACSLNNAYGRDRFFVRASLPLRDVKHVKDVAGVTLNDVALAVVGGALRESLLERGDLPDRPLVVNVPVSTEPAGSPLRQNGNRFASIATTLATDIADPWARLKRINEVTAVSRQSLDVLGPSLLVEWLEYAPQFLAQSVVRAHRWWQMRRPDDADFSVSVSNLRGPARHYHFDGAELEQIFLSGPPSYGVGANIQLWSYGDQLVFTMHGYADAFANPNAVAEGYGRALTELVARAELESAAASGRTAAVLPTG